MNSCGHHHVRSASSGSIRTVRSYQITIGGQQGNATAIGKVIGPSFYAEEVPLVIEALINVYTEQRTPNERFIDTLERIGIEPFKLGADAGRDKRKPANHRRPYQDRLGKRDVGESRQCLKSSKTARSSLTTGRYQT